MEENSKVKISVIMPVYNTKESDFRAAIESVLTQTYKNFEFIIINNASQTDVKSVVESYQDERIRYFELKENHGCAVARNFGIKNMRGEYYAAMDSDDIALPTRFEKEVEILDNNPNVVLVASWFRRFPEDKIVKAPLRPRLLDFLVRDFLVHSSLMIRVKKENLQEFLYREDNEVCDDIELYSRLIFKGEFYVIPEVLLDYRCEGQGISIEKSQKVAEIAKRIKHRQLDFLTTDKDLQKQIVKLLVRNYKIKKNFIERIFSVKNIAIFDSAYKVITILNIEIKIRKGSL